MDKSPNQVLQQMAGICPTSDGVRDDLYHYAKTLAKWNKSINLVAASTLDDIWHRHFLDSAQLWPHIPTTARTWADLGSGAGFPGLILAILAKDSRPNLHFTLIESDTRKGVFLRTLARELDLNVEVCCERIEEIKNASFDGISARALAPLPALLTYAQNFISAGGMALFLKGQNYAREVSEAQKTFYFKAEILNSETEAAARLLKITEITAKEKVKLYA